MDVSLKLRWVISGEIAKGSITLNYAALYIAEDIFHRQLLRLCPVIEIDTSRELPTGRKILNKTQATIGGCIDN